MYMACICEIGIAPASLTSCIFFAYSSTLVLGYTFLCSVSVAYERADDKISLANTNCISMINNILEIGTTDKAVPGTMHVSARLSADAKLVLATDKLTCIGLRRFNYLLLILIFTTTMRCELFISPNTRRT